MSTEPPSDKTPYNVVEIIGDLVSGTALPAPVRKNAFKAFDRLCTAAIDFPVAYLEGKAAEKRAETQGRIKLISTAAEQIAAQMNVDPEFARVAVNKYGQRIVREQINLNRVAEIASKQLQTEIRPAESEAPDGKDVAPINDDWLNIFEKEASQKSTEEMQSLFGRILAGEIRKPSSFSIKTIKLIGQLDQGPAKLFRLLCSLSVSLRVPDRVLDARVLSLKGNAAKNSLLAYGLGFGELNVLQEYGLIISDYDSYMNYGVSVADGEVVTLGFKYQNRDWGLVPSIPMATNQEVQLTGVALSRSGQELLPIVDLQENKAYSDALSQFFQKKSFSMVEIGKPMSAK